MLPAQQLLVTGLTPIIPGRALTVQHSLNDSAVYIAVAETSGVFPWCRKLYGTDREAAGKDPSGTPDDAA